MHNICEKLFRAVYTKDELPNYWKGGSITSAVFKDSLGVSVDRQGLRCESDALSCSINQFLERFIFSVTRKNCDETECLIKPDPTGNNDFHALVLRSEEIILLTSGQAKKLARAAEQEYQPRIFIKCEA